MRLSRLSLLIAGVLFAACARKQTHAAPPALPLSALRVALSSEATLGQLGDATDVVRRPWVEPIIQVLGEETPGSIAPLSKRRLVGSKLPADAMFERALTNLRAACPEPIRGDRTVKMAKANVQITRFADNHTAARLLLANLWSDIAAEAGGTLFAAAPARDIVVWTTSADENDQRALRGQARTAFQSRSYPISPAILRWTGNGWTLVDPNPIPPQ